MMKAQTAWAGQANTSSSSLHSSAGDARASACLIEAFLPAAKYEDH